MSAWPRGLSRGPLRALVAAAVLPALAACGLLSSPPERQLYRIQPSFTFPAGLPHAAVELAVATPSASAGLDTRRIALSTTPLSLDYFEGAEWADSVPLIVRSALVEGFEASGAVAAVGSASLGAHADVVLVPAIRDFEARYGDPHRPPHVEVALDLRLIALPQRRIVAATVVHGAAPAAANTVPAIIPAFNAALGRAVENAVAWTLATPDLSGRPLSVTSSRTRFVHPEPAKP